MVRPPAVASEETDTGAKTEEESDKENDAVRHILWYNFQQRHCK